MPGHVVLWLTAVIAQLAKATITGVLGEFLFMQQLASEKDHCSVISMNS